MVVDDVISVLCVVMWCIRHHLPLSTPAPSLEQELEDTRAELQALREQVGTVPAVAFACASL